MTTTTDRSITEALDTVQGLGWIEMPRPENHKTWKKRVQQLGERRGMALMVTALADTVEIMLVGNIDNGRIDLFDPAADWGIDENVDLNHYQRAALQRWRERALAAS